MKFYKNEFIMAAFLWVASIIFGTAVLFLGPKVGYFPLLEKSSLFNIPIVSLVSFCLWALIIWKFKDTFQNEKYHDQEPFMLPLKITTYVFLLDFLFFALLGSAFSSVLFSKIGPWLGYFVIYASIRLAARPPSKPR